MVDNIEKKIIIDKSFIKGFKRDSRDVNDYKFSSIPLLGIKLASEIPSKVDHSNNLTQVKSQGNLGSCVAFSSTALKEWQEKIEHDKEVQAGKKDFRKGKEYNLSEQWIYWNCKKIDEWPGEEGTSIRYAMKVLQKIGVPTEEGWTYSDSNINIGKPKSWAHLIARWATIGSYWRIDNLSELKIALVDSPVVIGILVHDEWNTNDGYIKYPANPDNVLGGHAILACGFDNEKEVIKIKNSWSIFWGDKGYGYIPYKYITDFMMDAWAVRDIAVTKDMLKGTVELLKNA